MLTFWDVGMVGAVLAVLLGGGGALLARVLRAHGVNLQGTVESLLQAQGDLKGEPEPEIEGRFAQIERRMAQLETDVLSYLRKGSQRYEQARKREARLGDAEEEEPVVTDAERQQLELAIGQGAGNGGSGPVTTLEDIRALMNRG